MKECSCGKFYETTAGVEMCQANNHGSGKDRFDDRHKFKNIVETEIMVYCAECQTPIRARVRFVNNSLIEIDVLPHVCSLDSDVYEKGGEDD